MIKTWLYRISPFVLAAVACIIPIILGIFTASKVLLLIFVPLPLLLAGGHQLVKWLTGNRLLYIWLIEGVLVSALIAWAAVDLSTPAVI